MFSKRAGKLRENERQVETETITKSKRKDAKNE
jgi:hypothetical protein